MKDEPIIDSWTDPETEARIIALVLGEASDFERAELERLMAEEPELAVFHRRMAAMTDLVKVAAHSKDLRPWRMEAPRRENVMRLLGAAPKPNLPKVSRFRQLCRDNFAWAAAVLILAALLVTFGTPMIGKAKEKARAPVALKDNAEDAGAYNDREADAPRDLAQTSEAFREKGKETEVLATEVASFNDASGASNRGAILEKAQSGQDALKVGLATESDDFYADKNREQAAQSPATLAQADSPASPRPAAGPSQPATASKPADRTAQGARHFVDLARNGIEMDLAKDGASSSDQRRFRLETRESKKLAENTPEDNMEEGKSRGMGLAKEKAKNRVDQSLAEASKPIRANIEQSAPQAKRPATNTLLPAEPDLAQLALKLDGLSDSERSKSDSPAPGKDGFSDSEESSTRGLAESQTEVLEEVDAKKAELQSSREKLERTEVASGKPDESEARFQVRTAVTSTENLLSTPIAPAEQPSNAQASSFGDIGPDWGFLASQDVAPSELKVESKFIEVDESNRHDLGFEWVEKDFLARSQFAPASRPESLISDLDMDSPDVEGARTAANSVVPAQPEKKAETPPPSIELQASAEPFSTFSLHVSDVSFRLAYSSLVEKGLWPATETIRAEEFINAFDYHDPTPKAEDKIACRIEQSAHPFLSQRNILRVALRTACDGRMSSQPLRLTLLIDSSGSMQRGDRRATAEAALKSLAAQLTPRDRISIISFARTVQLVKDRTLAADLNLPDTFTSIPSQGGTNLEEALKTAQEVAARQIQIGEQNRVVLFTDGAANLGDARPESLRERIVAMRGLGVAFDAVGIGLDGLNDAVLEALTREGDGRYYALNRPEEAEEQFAKKLAGALRPAARNVKVQLRLNPARVGAYRLVGFEKHRLKREDFRDDSVDAAELAAEESGVALYQFEAKPLGEGEVGEVSLRFQDVTTGRMVERSWTIPYEPKTPGFDQAAPSLSLAATAAYLAERLRDGPGKNVVPIEPFLAALPRLREGFPGQEAITRLSALWEKTRG